MGSHNAGIVRAVILASVKAILRKIRLPLNSHNTRALLLYDIENVIIQKKTIRFNYANQQILLLISSVCAPVVYVCC